QRLAAEVVPASAADVAPVHVEPRWAAAAICVRFVEAEARLGHLLFEDEEILLHALGIDVEADIRYVRAEVALYGRQHHASGVHFLWIDRARRRRRTPAGRRPI